jgi:fructose-bisphosphate aldolase class II
MTDICIARYDSFGASGNADKIKPISLDTMFDLYDAGKLNAIIK